MPRRFYVRGVAISRDQPQQTVRNYRVAVADRLMATLSTENVRGMAKAPLKMPWAISTWPTAARRVAPQWGDQSIRVQKVRL